MFAVRWTRKALDQLTSVWLAVNSAQRRAITIASNDIEARLQRDPLNEGESRPRGRRTLIVLPLGVTYWVDAQAKTVTVVRAWYVQPRPGRP